MTSSKVGLSLKLNSSVCYGTEKDIADIPQLQLSSLRHFSQNQNHAIDMGHYL